MATLRSKFIFWICLLFVLMAALIFIPLSIILPEKITAEIFTKINYYLAIVIFIGLGVGILIFALLGIFLSRRIIKLKDFAARVGSGEFNESIEIKAKDEIGSLAVSFNNMVQNLREKIETIKRLSYLEERTRIAVEFHDGLAQDLADIIKRLELCERLFKIDPARAFKELEILRENTKEVLHKTRQAISNLNPPQEKDFNLLNSLNNYLKNYQQQNEINVKIDVIGSLKSIAPHKAKHIFSIITEAFTNIRKHARAKNAKLHLEYNDNKELVIEIKDDGRGFIVEEAELSAYACGKLGLISMRQRTISLGGKLVINAKPNQGTDVLVNIPLAEKVI